MPQTFFHNSPCLQRSDLIYLILYDWQPCISLFCDITKGALWISTGCLGLQVPVAVSKFSDLVIGYLLLLVGDCCS